MANGHGGSRTPANPAPASGPGALSKRTDGQTPRPITGGEYGEGEAVMDLQRSAPMAQASTPQTQGQRAASQPSAAMPVGMGAPTQRPDEPVTEGNPLGAGSGPGVLSVPTTDGQRTQNDLAAFKPYLPMLVAAANQSNATPTFVKFVRQLRGMP